MPQGKIMENFWGNLKRKYRNLYFFEWERCPPLPMRLWFLCWIWVDIPPIIWISWRHWAVVRWHRNLLSTLKGYGRNQDTARGCPQATDEGWRIAGRTSRDAPVEWAMELAVRFSIYKRSESLRSQAGACSWGACTKRAPSNAARGLVSKPKNRA